MLPGYLFTKTVRETKFLNIFWSTVSMVEIDKQKYGYVGFCFQIHIMSKINENVTN